MNPSNVYRNALPIGYHLHEYIIQSVLGDGGFGITYLAKDTELNALVAIKEYLPNELAIRENDHTVRAKSSQDVEYFTWGLERFFKEARILAQFKHYNIVRVLRFFKAHQTAYIVMEYEQGQSLAKVFKRNQTATEAQLMKILPPLLNALETVHQAGYLHRDIKPDNIYLREKDNSPVLLDFGAARYVVGSRTQYLTTMTTAGYAPFEQYAVESNHGAWSDIYSMGAVLYRLITGKTPIDAIQRVDAIRRHKVDPLKPTVKIGRNRYSNSLLQAIDWALKINEKERPQNVTVWRYKLLKSQTSYFDKFKSVFLFQKPSIFNKRWFYSQFFSKNAKWYAMLVILIIGVSILVNIGEKPEQTIISNQQWELLQDAYYQFSEMEAAKIGQQIWKNENAGRLSGLISWDDDKLLLGIGHFVWSPKSQNDKFTDNFSDLIYFLEKKGVTIPLWLLNTSSSPWLTESDFIRNQETYQMISLRNLMQNTIPQQVYFMIERLKLSLPKMLETVPTYKQRQHIYTQIKRLVQTPKGLYAMIDYANFKGKAQDWGLLQVLEQMSSTGKATEDFANAAELILKRHRQNAPLDDAPWLRNWQNRINTYR
jgi:serine/threonine protein kinase